MVETSISKTVQGLRWLTAALRGLDLFMDHHFDPLLAGLFSKLTTLLVNETYHQYNRQNY